MKRVLIAIGLLMFCLFGYAGLTTRAGAVAPPPIPSEQQADMISVSKARREMRLLRQGRTIAAYRIALGRHGDGGPKQREGDERTPEGRYFINWRNPRSIAHLSLHISYPDAADEQAARAAGYSPGGNIMIHGLPNGWSWLGPVHHLWDWTDGCIAVTNGEVRDIWAKVPDGTPIEISP